MRVKLRLNIKITYSSNVISRGSLLHDLSCSKVGVIGLTVDCIPYSTLETLQVWGFGCSGYCGLGCYVEYVS